MSHTLNLIEETISHFNEGAKSVRAYSADNTYIITKAGGEEFFVADENQGFRKKKTTSLDEFYQEVFGIEATY